MSKRDSSRTLISIAAQGMHREQELCIAATESHDYDSMSDEEWVRLCEKISREAEASQESAECASEN